MTIRERNRWGPAATVGLGLLASCGGGSLGERGDAPRPNVILVTLDTTRVDRLSSYGHPLPLTPNFDALAEDGVRFEHAQVSAALTPVSHATILTGREPYGHGLRVLIGEGADRLPDDVPTLATLLGRAGWTTGAFLSAYPVSERYGLDRGFDVFESGVVEPPEDSPRQKKNQRRSDLTTDRALEWLGQVEEPFFLWIHYWDPHDPLATPPRKALTRYRELASAQGLEPSIYDAEVHYVDRQFGRLVESLRADGRYERTAICVTADHGEGLGEHDWHAHRLLYEEQIHVPLLLRWPAGPSGRTVPYLVRTSDITPTLLEILDVGTAGALEGASLLALVEGTESAPRVAYAESLAKWDAKDSMVEQRPDDDLLHMICDGRFKLIYKPSHPERSELYDLPVDPDEARNLYAELPEVVSSLLADLRGRDPFVSEPFSTAPIDAAAEAALSELGYGGDASDDGANDDE